MSIAVFNITATANHATSHWSMFSLRLRSQPGRHLCYITVRLNNLASSAKWRFQHTQHKFGYII